MKKEYKIEYNDTDHAEESGKIMKEESNFNSSKIPIKNDPK